jgi:hypothetical protein
MLRGWRAVQVESVMAASSSGAEQRVDLVRGLPVAAMGAPDELAHE